MEGFEIGRFRRAGARLLAVNMRITRTTAILPPLMEGVGGLALIVALFYGSLSIRGGHLTTGAFVAFLTALFAMYTPVKRLSRVNATLQAALAAGDARLRGARPPRRGAREEGRDRAASHARGDRVPRCRLRLRRRARRRAAPGQLQRAPRRGGGDRRHQRLGQDDAREPAPALLRRHRGRDPDRRRGRAPRVARQPARADRARHAGDRAVQRHRARQHRLRHGRRRRGARRVGGARGLRPRLHPEPAAPLRHRDRRAGQPALGRAEAAHRDRARDPEGSADPDPGRGHLRARRGVRAPGPGARSPT